MSIRESGKIVEKKRTKFDTVVAENVPFRWQSTCTIQTLDFQWHNSNSAELSFRGKVLYVRTNSVVVGKIERNLKPRVVAVSEPSIDKKSRRNVQLLYHWFLTPILIYE